MIPGKILHFLDSEGTIGISGTRDGDLIPHLHFVSGWSVESDRQTIRCSVNQAFTDHLIDSLEDNGQFSLTIEQIGSHETYQLKGTYIDSTQPTDADIVAHRQIKHRFVAAVTPLFGFPKELSEVYIAPPNVVVRFTVREIFLQTPGPGAGHRVFPPQER